MAKFRIISKKELQEVTERYFGECKFVYNYEYECTFIRPRFRA